MDKKRFVSVLLLVVLVLIVFSFRDSLFMLSDKEFIEGIVAGSGALGPLIFMAVYGLVLLVGLPAIPLTLAGGYIFGFVQGTIYVLVIATLMAAVGFYIPRLFGLSFQSRDGKKSKGIKKIVVSIEKEVEENGLLTILLVRPLFGYMLLSYAAGFIKKLKFNDFIIATIIMNLIFTPVYVFLGDRIMSGFKGLIFPLILVIIVFFIGRYIKKVRKKKKNISKNRVVKK